MNIMLVIVALLFNLLSGGTTSNVPTTIVRGPIPTILFSSCTCTAETSTWTEHTNKNMTKPIILKMGIRHTGGAKAPPLEFMATWIQVSTLILISKWIITSKKSLSTLLWKVWKLWPASTLMERLDTALVSAQSTSILHYSFSTLHRLIWCRAIQQAKETCLPKSCNYKISQSQLALRDLYIFITF